MNRFVLGVALLAACATTAPQPAQAPQPAPTYQTERVDVSRFNGQFVGTVRTDGQPVTEWLRNNSEIAGVRYSGTRENNDISVTVETVAKDGQTTPLATYRVQPGQMVSVDLSKFGLPPMTLRGSVRATEQ